MPFLPSGIRKDRRGGRLIKHKRQKEDTDQKLEEAVSERRSPSLWVNPSTKNMKKNPVASMTVEQLLSALIEAEPPIVYSEHDPGKLLSEASMMTLLTNLADKELVHMINWAKRVPGRDKQKLHISVA
ncbi:hypothetical protein NDU88_005890 [Pleurodeles waltl]|uniref:NR LBD domain-containing protein n=1 Tax=Pleurodeles waltl TaxID=8319 RepID=A0AAV7RPQ1_PLEWA|nr:hypothetical protein NDU88_005890 [Pleurodeles waltl]